MKKPLQVLAIAAVIALTATAHAAKNRKVIPAEILARIHGAHRIFVANGGLNTTSAPGSSDTSAAYTQLYKALAAWPGVQLVDTPEQADLIFQESVEGANYDEGLVIGNHGAYEASSSGDTFVLRVLDPQGGLLWEDTLGVASGLFAPATGYAAKAVTYLLAPMVNKHRPDPVKTPAVLPLAMQAPKSLYLTAAPPATSGPSTPAAMVAPVQQALAHALGSSYNLVNSAAEADLTLSLSLVTAARPGDYPYESMTLSLMDPKSGVLLWNMQVVFVQDPNPAGQIRKTMPYFLEKWGLVVGKKTVGK